MFSKSNLFFGIFICFALFSVAKAQDVQVYVPAGVDFSHYKTYKWQRAKDARYPDAQSDKLIMDAVDIELAKKGFTKTESDTADVYVVYQIAIVEGAEWNTYASDVPWQGGLYNTIGTFTGPTTNSTTFIKVGWLNLDIYDVRQKRQVWQATARKVLSASTDPKKRAKNAQKVMAKVFKNYPLPVK